MSDLSLPEPAQPKHALDVQHDTDPEQDHGLARRIPHLGHALLFFSLAGFFILLCMVIVVIALHATTPERLLEHPNLLGLAQLMGYALTFAVAFPLFPQLWKYSFLEGIHWTYRAARLRWWKLILLGVVLSVIAQVIDRFVPAPKDIDILQLLKTPLAAWITALSGSFVVPIVEEIAFRGFLLPAVATAYDWLALERTPAALNRWQLTTQHTRPALVFGAILSSVAFTSLHGDQLHWTLGPLAVLFAMSLVFSAVRVRTRSVAASSLVHIAYNTTLFVEMFVSTGGFRHLDKLAS